MKLMVRLCFLVCLFFLSKSLLAQDIKVKSLDEMMVPNDSLTYITLNDFASLVIANHPVVRQADLMTENALEELRLARGAFDPKLSANWDVKKYKGTDYYDKLVSELKIPTWFPVDPKVAFYRNDGDNLNPENIIPSSDDFMQMTAGVSLPIGKGLLIDQRRADVKKAQIFNGITEAERIKAINKVLLSAAKVYWDWYFQYYNFLLIDESLAISEEVYRRVKLDFEFGEAAKVDTLQASITYQNRISDWQEALISYKRSSLMLSNFLWSEEMLPLELSENMVPNIDADAPVFDEVPLDSLAKQAMVQHPELRKLSLKLDQLDVQERLAKENLKPTVNLNYNFINAPINPSGESAGFSFSDNYKFGVDFEFPIFLRKERAKLRQTRIKIDQINYEQDLKQQEVLNGIEAAYFNLANSEDLILVVWSTVDNYKLLLEAELLNLSLGESDLFKINFQQDKLLEAQIKLVKLKSAVEKSKAELYWAAGFEYLKFPTEAPKQE